MSANKPRALFATREARNMLADVHGAKAAAWLLRPLRAQLHEVGSVEFLMPFGHRVPSWFTMAITCLKRRPNWRVRSFTTTKGNVWRVEWLAHSRFHPGAMVSWPTTKPD